MSNPVVPAFHAWLWIWQALNAVSIIQYNGYTWCLAKVMAEKECQCFERIRSICSTPDRCAGMKLRSDGLDNGDGLNSRRGVKLSTT